MIVHRLGLLASLSVTYRRGVATEMKKPKSKSQDLRFTGARALRSIHALLGLVLIAAGTLKLYDFAFAVQEDDLSALFFGILSEVEFLAGIWLLLGIQPEQTRPWVVALFSGLGASGLYQAIIGRCSCGCFGSIAVNPGYVLVFDMAAVGVLLAWRPSEENGEIWSSPSRVGALVLLALVVGTASIGKQSLAVPWGRATRNGQPLADAVLVFRGNWTGLQVTTDQDGLFHLPPIRPGRYAVTTTVRDSPSDPKAESLDRGRAGRKSGAPKEQESYGGIARRRGQQNSRASSPALTRPDDGQRVVPAEVDECSRNEVVLDFT